MDWNNKILFSSSSESRSLELGISGPPSSEAELPSPSGGLRRNPPFAFLLLVAAGQAMAPINPISAFIFTLSSLVCLLLPVKSSFTSLLWGHLWVHSGPTQIIQDNQFISRSVTELPVQKGLFPYKITFTDSRTGLDCCGHDSLLQPLHLCYLFSVATNADRWQLMQIGVVLTRVQWQAKSCLSEENHYFLRSGMAFLWNSRSLQWFFEGSFSDLPQTSHTSYWV